jgi:uncharacterized RDD family membrane protein YckC
MNEQNLRRGAAVLIDLFLISIVYSVLINLMPQILMTHEMAGIQLSIELAPDGFLMVSFAYFIGCDLFNKGESLGKDIMGLQTRGAEGRVLDLQNRLYRTLLKMVSLALWPVAILIYFREERGLTLQDYVVQSTVSVQRRFRPVL